MAHPAQRENAGGAARWQEVGGTHVAARVLAMLELLEHGNLHLEHRLLVVPAFELDGNGVLRRRIGAIVDLPERALADLLAQLPPVLQHGTCSHHAPARPLLDPTPLFPPLSTDRPLFTTRLRACFLLRL